MISSRPRRRSLAVAAAAVAAATLALAGCSSTDAAAPAASAADASAVQTRTVETHYGAVEVPADPQRVVAVSYDTVWQLRSVGVTAVGAQDYSAYATQFTETDLAFAADIPVVGAFFEVNFEAVAAAAPDLIVGDALEIDDATYARLSAIAPTAIYSAEYRGDWRAIGSGVADAVNRSDEFDTLASRYSERIDALKETYAPELTGKRWAAISEGESTGDFSVLHPTGVLGALWFKDLGAAQAPGAGEANENGFTSVSAEMTSSVLGEADVVVAPAQADSTLNETITGIIEAPLFSTLPAAQNGDVYWVYSSVTDYASALTWLDTVESTVLAPLSAKR